MRTIGAYTVGHGCCIHEYIQLVIDGVGRHLKARSTDFIFFETNGTYYRDIQLLPVRRMNCLTLYLSRQRYQVHATLSDFWRMVTPPFIASNLWPPYSPNPHPKDNKIWRSEFS